MSDRLLAGVDIGGTKTAVVLSEEPPIIASRSHFPTEGGPETTIEKIVSSLEEMLRQMPHRRLSHIGISCGGPLDHVRGHIQQPPNLTSWIDVPITAILSEKFGVPCSLENDANAGALAEHAFGAGKGVKNLIFLTMGTGLGAGLILNGALYAGVDHIAGEIGHVRLTDFGPEGYGKVGSAEAWASGAGLAKVGQQTIREERLRGGSTILAAANGVESVTAREIAAAAKQNDPLAQRIIQQAGERLGQAMAILVDILNPERIIVGSLAVRLGDALLGPARAVVEREALRTAAQRCQIVAASLGEEIGDVAALCVAMQGEKNGR